jgi:hypothetical protein
MSRFLKDILLGYLEGLKYTDPSNSGTKIYPVDTPVWLVFLMIGINLVFAIPLSFLSAPTGTNLGLGALIQVITGFILPNNPNAFLFARTLGSWALAGYRDNYVQDRKMAHYCKIAPRAVFRSQIGTIIIICFVAVGTQDFILTNIKGLCTPDQPSRFTCICLIFLERNNPSPLKSLESAFALDVCKFHDSWDIQI